MSAGFESLISMLPIEWETALAKGITYFTEELDADEVKFEVASNGVAISIVCDEEAQRDAADFWVNHVEPALNEGGQ